MLRGFIHPFYGSHDLEWFKTPYILALTLEPTHVATVVGANQLNKQHLQQKTERLS